MPTERRNFTRIPIPWDQSATFLRSGLQQFTVHLINATPQGFAVTCPERLNVNKGDTLQLRTSEGWVEVRVARIEPFENDQDFPEEYDCYLGLQRLRELGYEPDNYFVTASNPRLFLCGLFLALVVAALAAAFFLPQSKSAWRDLQSAFTSLLPTVK